MNGEVGGAMTPTPPLVNSASLSPAPLSMDDTGHVMEMGGMYSDFGSDNTWLPNNMDLYLECTEDDGPRGRAGEDDISTSNKDRFDGSVPINIAANDKVSYKVSFPSKDKGKGENGDRFSCEICTKSFTRESLMKDHKSKVHGVRDLFHCHLCSYTGQLNRHLTKHIKRKHGEKAAPSTYKKRAPGGSRGGKTPNAKQRKLDADLEGDEDFLEDPDSLDAMSTQSSETPIAKETQPQQPTPGAEPSGIETSQNYMSFNNNTKQMNPLDSLLRFDSHHKEQMPSYYPQMPQQSGPLENMSPYGSARQGHFDQQQQQQQQQPMPFSSYGGGNQYMSSGSSGYQEQQLNAYSQPVNPNSAAYQSPIPSSGYPRGPGVYPPQHAMQQYPNPNQVSTPNRMLPQGQHDGAYANHSTMRPMYPHTQRYPTTGHMSHPPPSYGSAQSSPAPNSLIPPTSAPYMPTSNVGPHPMGPGGLHQSSHPTPAPNPMLAAACGPNQHPLGRSSPHITPMKQRPGFAEPAKCASPSGYSSPVPSYVPRAATPGQMMPMTPPGAPNLAPKPRNILNVGSPQVPSGSPGPVVNQPANQNLPARPDFTQSQNFPTSIGSIGEHPEFRPGAPLLGRSSTAEQRGLPQLTPDQFSLDFNSLGSTGQRSNSMFPEQSQTSTQSVQPLPARPPPSGLMPSLDSQSAQLNPIEPRSYNNSSQVLAIGENVPLQMDSMTEKPKTDPAMGQSATNELFIKGENGHDAKAPESESQSRETASQWVRENVNSGDNSSWDGAPENENKAAVLDGVKSEIDENAAATAREELIKPERVEISNREDRNDSDDYEGKDESQSSMVKGDWSENNLWENKDGEVKMQNGSSCDSEENTRHSLPAEENSNDDVTSVEYATDSATQDASLFEEKHTDSDVDASSESTSETRSQNGSTGVSVEEDEVLPDGKDSSKSGSSLYKCAICHKQFSNRTGIYSHTKIVHAMTRNFSCTKAGCGKSFKSSSARNEHMITVHGKKNFHCSEPGCSKSFALERDLKSHCKVHTSIHKCTWKACAKTFRDKYNLKVHMKTHTGEKNRACHLCEFTCIQRSSLNWHVKSKHPNDYPDYIKGNI